MNSVILNEIIITIIGTILGVLVEIILNGFIEKIRLKKNRVYFFINGLFYKGTNNNNNEQYLLKGSLVSRKGKMQSKAYFKLCKDLSWDKEATKYYKSTQRTDNNYYDEVKTDFIINTNEANKLVLKDIELDEFTIYKIDGYFSAQDTFKPSGFLLVEMNDTSKIEVIKCPNIRKKWLLFYIIFSIFTLITVSITTFLCIHNWDTIMKSNIELKTVFFVLGVLLCCIALFFIVLIWKLLDSYRTLLKMKKYKIPEKKDIQSTSLLIPAIIEYMSGSEKLSNVL